MNSKYRTLLLAVTAIATAFTLGKSIANPDTISPVNRNYTFIDPASLSQWQLADTKPLTVHQNKPKEYITGDFIAGKNYRYQKDGQSLDIEMRYFADTNGNLKDFITSQTGELSSALKEDGDRGSYSIYTHENKAYLNACINPRGKSTVTSDEFNRNLMAYDTRLSNIVPWLLSRAEFRDKRCLWTNLSMHLDNNISVDDTYNDLETAWFDWYDYWQANYPQR